MKFKIAIIGAKGIPATGGTARVCESLIEYLKNDFQFVVYSTASHAKKNLVLKDFKQIIIPKFPIKKLNIYFYYLCSYFHAIFFSKYDIIHIHLIDSGVFIPFLRLRYKNIIGTAHGRAHLINKFGIVERFFLKFSEIMFLNFSSYITVVAKPLVATYSQMINKHIHFIPNGVNLNITVDTTIISKELSKYKLSINEYLLFSAGRIIPIKGCHLFLEAVMNFNIPLPSVIIGDINQIPYYKIEIEKMMIEANAIYLGFMEEKIQLLAFVAAAKFFIFPSTHEAMSMMLLEVASLHVPIICSDIAENKAIFNEDEVLFFCSGNSKDLAEKILWANKNMELMKCKANKAYNKLTLEYSWSKISQYYKNLYLSIINKS